MKRGDGQHPGTHYHDLPGYSDRHAVAIAFGFSNPEVDLLMAAG